jgi:hypothetical protein
MKTPAGIAILLGLGVLAYAQQSHRAVVSVSWKLQPPVSGRYVPDPSKSWFAGEIVQIDGTNFHYTQFTDVGSARVPDYRGRVLIFKDHIYLDHPGMAYPYRISGLLTNRPVIWTWKGYEQWRKSGEIDELDILYLEIPGGEQGAATKGSQPSRSQTNRTSSATGFRH